MLMFYIFVFYIRYTNGCFQFVYKIMYTTTNFVLKTGTHSESLFSNKLYYKSQNGDLP